MMNCSLRTACLIAATTFAALPLAGCKVTIEPLVRYEGTPVTETVAYTPGTAIHIIGANGQIEVVRGTTDEVKVTFSPFTMDEDTAEERAVSEMENKLELTAANGTSELLIEAAKGDGSSSYLGADIKVTLPSTFDGGFEVDQGNGSIEADLSGGLPTSTDVVNDGGGSIKVTGARGKLHIVGSAGDVEVSVAEWAIDDGSVETGAGDLVFTLPGAVNGTLSATAGGNSSTIIESGIPATWATAGEGGAKSYTMGDGMGAHVDLTTDLGDITITAK